MSYRMNAILLLSFLSATTQISGELLFIPSSAQTEQVDLHIPGHLVNKEDALPVLTEDTAESVNTRKPAAGVESRAKPGRQQAASVRQGSSPIISFQADTARRAAAPLCLACTCRVGRTSCREAGGVAFRTVGGFGTGNPPAVPCSAAAPCVFEASDTMSACDPECRRRTATCDTQLVNPICTDNVNNAFCRTDCEFRESGEKVVCNQQAIARGVMNDIPQEVCNIFGGRKRRDLGAEQRGFNDAGFLRNSFLGRLIPSPASTIQIPGSALLAYAPTGRCLPQEVASTPLCTKLN